MSAGGGAAAGGGHPDFGLSAPNQHDAPISGAELAALDAAMFDTDNMMAQNTISPPSRVNFDRSFNPNLTNIGILDGKKQHEIAKNLIERNIPSLLGNPHRERTEEMERAIRNATRHAMLVGATNTGFANFREGLPTPLSDQEEADFTNNDAMGNFMSANPGASFEDAIASIGQATAQNNPYGWDPAVFGGMTPGMGPGEEALSAQHQNTQQSLPNQSVVNQALNEANARNKTAARERAKALAKEAARLKAKEEHRIQVLKDRADKKAAEEQWNPNIVPEEEVIPIQLPPLVIDDGPTTHEANVAKREATKARLATARGKTKAHFAKLRSKGVSAKTMAKAKSKAKARYAKIKSR